MATEMRTPLVVAWFIYALGALALSLVFSNAERSALVLWAPHLVDACLAGYLVHKHLPMRTPVRALIPWMVAPAVIFFTLPLMLPAGSLAENAPALHAIAALPTASICLPFASSMLQLLSVLVYRHVLRRGASE